MSSERNQQAAAARSTTSSERRSLGKVLVADDQPALRSSIMSVLKEADFEVMGAQDGREAVDIFAAEGAGICAVLLDVGMPRLNGVKAGEAIQSLSPKVPIILMSGYMADPPPPGMEVLPKPFRVDELLAMLDRLLA